jgi:hypothetical protein
MPFTEVLSNEYKPPTPFGKFHVSMNPANNKVTVTVRVGWDFQNSSNKRGDVPWNATSIGKYKRILRQRPGDMERKVEISLHQPDLRVDIRAGIHDRRWDDQQ